MSDVIIPIQKDENYRRDATSQLLKVWHFFLPFLVVSLTWELLVQTGIIHLASIPAPSAIILKLWDLTFVRGVLLQHFFASLTRLMLGYSIAVFVGITLGAAISQNPILRAFIEPILSLLISVPTIAWLPVLLITMGIGNLTVITAVFLGSVFSITYNTMRGMDMINKSLVNAARMMGLNGIPLFFKVLLPGSLVSLITGLRLGIGYAWRALVGGEMLSAMIEWGLGKMVFQARFFNDVNVMFAGVILIGVSGYLLDHTFLRWLEQATVERWGMLTKK
jgi:NitT/TauT family transport system permease protein